MDYPKLITELKTDPQGRNYAAMSDSQVAADLNLPRISIPDASSYVTIRSILDAFPSPDDSAAFLAGMRTVAATNATVDEAMKLLSPSQGGLPLGNAQVRAMLDSLATANVITTDAATRVKSLGEKLISRGEELSLGDPVGDGHVKSARELIAGGA